jgi:hypothetical protein
MSKEIHIGMLFTNQSKVYRVVNNDIKNFTIEDIMIPGKIHMDTYEFTKQMLMKYSYNDMLETALYQYSLVYPYVIVDIKGNLAATKVPKKEYLETRKSLGDQNAEIAYYENVIKVIALPNFDECIERGIIFLPEIYKDHLFSLMLHIRTRDFYLDDLSTAISVLSTNPRFDEYNQKMAESDFPY